MPIDLVQLFQILDHGLPMIYKHHVCVCVSQSACRRMKRAGFSGPLCIRLLWHPERLLTYWQGMCPAAAMTSMYLKRGRSESQSGPLRILAVLFYSFSFFRQL